ncbi:hypothetical protein EWB00_004315 [Schistosoma japonicum]|uniref:Pre-rRNA-processing protein Ipi1 N-terminal domain-containing protein n=1 Tax=Schistosoma japonicum TaxID=6182 RepID=A0A4Z2D5R4_SCHJA|nr:hypothetical protein EWB00_004315 [Schistosoma japonicum]TNN11833.1 hypothetical protein EWB00_004315 [Schistosoma japonicum]TNN11834.1 hypothetical protein EWB00_004315 [Schistosoma japonicum]TNN11835.1 hypothetical protein EWB00_004315 [Schistosoma japonicum]
MVKSKKDFQKVRIKVGRKLKSQNETVINLQKKKIILPKEREIAKSQGHETSVQIFESSIRSLNIEDKSLRQSALRALNRLLDPLAKQITTYPFLDKNVLTLSSNLLPKVVSSQRKLLESSLSMGCDIQLGNLIFILGRFCRSVDDPCFCDEIRHLFIKIVQIAYTHPKISDIIFELDQVVLNLLHRSEQVWKFFGCYLSTYSFSLHHKLIKSMSILYQPSSRIKSVYSAVFDSIQQSIRFRAFTHLLIQCYNNLKQNCTFKILSKYRADLVRATMIYLKDNQYTVSLSYSQSCHPWLYSLPYFSNDCCQLYITLKGYYLKELVDFHPTPRCFVSSLFSDAIKPSLVFPSPTTHTLLNDRNARNKQGEKYQKNYADKISDNSIAYFSTWYQENYDDRIVVHGLIGEGLILLDELCENPSVEVLSSIYYFLRALRAIFETKDIGFFTSYSGGKHDYTGWKLGVNEISPDLSTSLERFLAKFYSIYPLQLSPDSSLFMHTKYYNNNLKNKNNNQGRNYFMRLNSFTGQKPVNLTRKQLKQERKRKNKQLKRQLETAAGGDDNDFDDGDAAFVDNVASTTNSIDSSTNNVFGCVMKTNNFSTKGNPNSQALYWIQLINQSAFELFTYIEYYSFQCSNVDFHSPFLWPPPKDTQERLIELWFNQLLCCRLFNGITSDAYYATSCWLRSFDLYLLSPLRRKWDIDISTRLFTSPVIIFLGQLFHQFANTDKSLSKREHYITGRCAGLLTTVLTRELLFACEYKTELEKNIEDDESPSVNVKCNYQAKDYDETWLRDKLSHYNLSDNVFTSLHQSIFPNFVNCLVQLSLKQSPRVYYAPPLTEQTLNIVRNQYSNCNISIGNLKQIQIVDSTWTACLRQLYNVKYSLVVKNVCDNTELCTKLYLTETYLDNLTPINILIEKLNIQCDNQLLENQTAWLVPGFLPRITDGRYTCPVFWRPLKDNGNNTLSLF